MSLTTRFSGILSGGIADVALQGASYAFSAANGNKYHSIAQGFSFSGSSGVLSFAIGLTSEIQGATTANGRVSVDNVISAGVVVRSGANATGQMNRVAPQLGPSTTLIFPYNRWSDRALGTVTASSEIATFPASNTQLPQRSKVWRSSADTSAYLLRNLGSAFRINSVALVSHNATNTGKFRVRIGNSSTFATTLYDSGWLDTWEKGALATTGTTSEFANSFGQPTAATIELLRYCSENARTVRWIVFDEVAAQYIRIDFQDSANVLGWNELSYVYAGLCVSVDPSQLYGWSLELASVNRTQVAASGQMWIDDMHKKMVATANFAARPAEQTIAFWLWISEKLGTTGEFIISFQPENAMKRMYYTIYGHLLQTPDIENASFQTFNLQLQVEELL